MTRASLSRRIDLSDAVGQFGSKPQETMSADARLAVPPTETGETPETGQRGR
jgi:hypothetical protein